MPRKVSTCVIVLNYFDYNSTLKCLESLINQQFDTLYIVDNSGNDKEGVLTLSLRDKLKQHELSFKIEILINKENLGFGAGINAAVAKDFAKTCGHDYYLLLNNDAILSPNTITRMTNKCLLNNNIALASPRIDWGGEIVCFRGYNKYFGHVRDRPNKTAEPYLTGCCLLVDRVLINAKGHIFDEDFFMYGEDIELNWRAKKMGKEICCVSEVTIFHEGTGSSSHGDFFYEYHVVRGHFLLGIKATSFGKKISIYSIARVLYLIIRAIIRCIRFQSLVPFKATFFAFINVMF